MGARMDVVRWACSLIVLSRGLLAFVLLLYLAFFLPTAAAPRGRYGALT
jgi:hypothetical protein